MSTLEGRTVLVTGASKGIGAAIASAMLDAGANVIAHYGHDRKGAEAAIAAAPDRARLISADFADPASIPAFWAEVCAKGVPDVLVNNAAIMRQAGGISDDAALWDDTWDEAWRVNVLSPAQLMRLAVRDWLAAGRPGGIIGIGYWEGAICSTDPRAAAKAMKHVRDLVGIQHVALGSDYDGATTVRFDTSQLVQVTQALLDEGFTADEIRAVMGENALRVIRAGLVPMAGSADQ